MPNKPLKPCRYPLCKKLVTSAYCDEHKKRKSKDRHEDQIRKDYNKHKTKSKNQYQKQKDYDKYSRDKESKRFYTSSAWLKCRKAILARDNYLCQICFKEGRLEPATLVHHKKCLKDDRTLALTEENLISVCDSCHNRAHGSVWKYGDK